MPSPAAGVSGSGGSGNIWKVHAVLVLVQCLIGGTYILDKIALTAGVNLIVFAVYKDAVGLCVLIPVAYFTERGKRPRLDLATLGLFVLLGLLGIFATQLLFLFGIQLATATLASFSSINVPICVFFFSAVFGIEDINWRRLDGQAKAGGVMSAVLGAVIIVQYKGPAILGAPSAGVHSGTASELQLDGNVISKFTELHLSLETWQIGVILLFLGGVCVSIYLTLQIPILKRFPAPVSMAAFACFFGGLTITAAGLITVQDHSEWVIHEPSAIVAVVYAGVTMSAANAASQSWALQRAGPVLVASYSPLHLCITSFLALIFIGETLYLGSVLGILLVISGLYSITWGKLEGQKLAAQKEEAVPTPVGLPSIKAGSNLEEPLLEEGSVT